MKINLGSGNYPKKDFVNVDKREPADVIHDLNTFPYPFESESADLIESDYLLEHLSDPMRVMKELHRILRKNGRLAIKVSHFSRGYACPNHQRGFDVSFPYYFNPSFNGEYSGTEFKVEKLRLIWNVQHQLKKDTLGWVAYPLLIIGKILDFFANLSPAFCSRIWCGWVGGFEGMEFIFKKSWTLLYFYF